MKHRWAALGIVLALSALAATSAAAQGGNPPTGRERQPDVTLGQNYPNPFNPETRIPFTLGNPTQCTDPGRMFRVSLTVYNVLAQPIAIPLLMGEGAPPDLAGQSLRNLLLPCGQYTAYWDGKVLNTSEEAASGLYIARLEVDGRVITRKMIVTK